MVNLWLLTNGLKTSWVEASIMETGPCFIDLLQRFLLDFELRKTFI